MDEKFKTDVAGFFMEGMSLLNAPIVADEPRSRLMENHFRGRLQME